MKVHRAPLLLLALLLAPVLAQASPCDYMRIQIVNGSRQALTVVAVTPVDGSLSNLKVGDVIAARASTSGVQASSNPKSLGNTNGTIELRDPEGKTILLHYHGHQLDAKRCITVANFASAASTKRLGDLATVNGHGKEASITVRID